MIQKLGGLVLCASLACAVPAWAKDLPDACGDETVHFNVATQGSQPLPAPPPPSKAEVVFIETLDRDSCLVCSHITTRAAVDGVWMGANKDQSYFASTVEPGKHQVCTDWQRVLYGQVDVASFTAEPGMVYYFLVKVTDRLREVGDSKRKEESVKLIRLDDGQAKYMMKNSDLSTAEVYK